MLNIPFPRRGSYTIHGIFCLPAKDKPTAYGSIDGPAEMLPVAGDDVEIIDEATYLAAKGTSDSLVISRAADRAKEKAKA